VAEAWYATDSALTGWTQISNNRGDVTLMGARCTEQLERAVCHAGANNGDGTVLNIKTTSENCSIHRFTNWL